MVICLRFLCLATVFARKANGRNQEWGLIVQWIEQVSPKD